MKGPSWLYTAPAPKWIFPVVAMAVLMAAMLLPTVIHLIFPPDPGPDPNHLPIYPGGHDVLKQDYAGGIWRVESATEQTPSIGATAHVTTYFTDAKPESVFDFYKRVMPGLGWGQPTVQGDGSLYFFYIGREGWPGGTATKMASLLVKASPVPSSTGPNQTLVELNTGWQY